MPSVFRTDKHPVLAANGKGANGALGGIVVNAHFGIRQKCAKVFFAAEVVINGFAHAVGSEYAAVVAVAFNELF